MYIYIITPLITKVVYHEIKQFITVGWAITVEMIRLFHDFQVNPGV